MKSLVPSVPQVPLLVPLLLLALSSVAADAGFAGKLKVTRAGDGAQIEFAVTAPVDAAVFVEDARGQVVRHLAAGVLGTNAPAPFQPGLAQKLAWDGKADYGRPATGGPFQVRVALGLGAKYDRVLSSRPLSFAGASALGTGPDGAVYLRYQYTPSVWQHAQLLVLNRDGTYRRTLLPFAATADGREAVGFDTLTVDGRPVPAGRDGGERDLYVQAQGPGYSTLAVSPDGKDLYALAGACGVMRLATAGGCPQPPLVALLPRGTNGLGNEPVFTPSAYAAISPDGKHLYLNGLGNRYNPAPLSAVYRLDLPERTGLAVFFGDPKKAGSDATLLGAAAGGMACDAEGNLLVADTPNNRVLVIGAADGKCRGQIPFAGARGVGVDPRKGAVYISSEKNGVVRIARFDGWKEPKLLAETQVRRKGWAAFHTLAVDASADPVVLWLSAGGDGQFVRLEDRGDKFEAAELSADWRGGQPQECYLGVVVDRTTREVYVRNGGSGGIWERFDDDTGTGSVVRLPSDAWSDGGGKGTQLTPAPNGNLYGIKWEHSFFQWDRNGKPLAWAEPRIPGERELQCYEYEKKASKVAHVAYVPVGMTEQPHTLGVRWSDSHLFVLEPYLFPSHCGGRTFKALHEYLPSGRRVTTVDHPILWKISDGAVGPKFDAAGNIYVAEFIRPKGWLYPPEVRSYLDARGGAGVRGKGATITALYGSMVKFSPKGGMVHWPRGGKPDGTNTSNEGAWAGPDPFEGQPQLDPALPVTEAEFYSWEQLRTVKVTGAEWIRPGVGNVSMFRCNCENVTFDVDEFGRVFFPDLCRFQVGVLDTAGNDVTHLGGYGNPDNRGPDSAVADPKSGQLRPRRADDPATLKSPLAEPDIALAWPSGIGVTDKHLYVGDPVNRRLLRARLTYQAEARAEIK
jgi:DNA-binding beta-propeller fold protein YncE